MVEGKMVQSGGCRQIVKDKIQYPNNKDSTSTTRHGGVCALKEGDIYINWNKNGQNSAFKPKTWPERVEIKNMIGYPSELLANAGAAEKKAFIQKGFNSNLEIPGQNNPVLNGKGYTFNQLPNERYDDDAERFLYKSKAYDSGKHSVRPATEVQKGIELAKKLAEENKAIGVDLAVDDLIKQDNRFNQFKMKLPDWICSAVCGGLNMDDISSGEANIEEPEDFDEGSSNLFPTEEGYHIDSGRHGLDKRLNRPPSATASAMKN